MSTRKKVLVVYYSLTGNTARVARDLAKRLDADIESIHDAEHGVGFLGQLKAAYDAWRQAPARIARLQRNPSEFAVTIVGTPVWMRRMTPALRAFLLVMRGRFRRVAFFVTSGNTDVETLVHDLEASGLCRAVAIAGFNQRELRDPILYERKLSNFVQAIERGMAAPPEQRFASAPSGMTEGKSPAG